MTRSHRPRRSPRPPRSGVLLALACALACPAGAGAQAEPSDLPAMASWVAVDMVTGYETRHAPELARSLDGWTADRWGNLVRTVGRGRPRRVVACGLDRPGYAVSQITEDGYLRVHRIGRGSWHPLWDQAHEAQQLRVLTASGPLAAVAARANGHFAAQHRDEVDVVDADDLWIDVGADSRAEAQGLGIELLDPVSRHLPPWTLEGEVAGPDAGRRVGCAAVATLAEAAASGGAPDGETVFVLSAQEVLGHVGLSSLIARGPETDALVVLAPGAARTVDERRATDEMGRTGAALQAGGVDTLLWLAPATRAPASHMEGVSLAEAGALLGRAAEASGVALPERLRWIEAPEPAALRTAHADPAQQPVADMLEALVERHGAPGHEWAVRRYVLEALPAWARDAARVDDMGNVWVAVGPDRDTTVFMAHMDEVGYEVESVGADGVVTLDRLGGAVSSAWEGQTALLHFDPEGAPSSRTGAGEDTGERWKLRALRATAPAPLRGVFLTRAEPESRHPPEPLRAWFGMDGEELRARGVRPGMAVTSHKEGLRLGRHRFVARALDDRAGTTALIRAVNALDPERLQGKVIFAFSVHEEGGLIGAAAMARRFGATARRIYSVDTFVSSDTPLESPHFAYAPLGEGPVLRAIENSSVSPDRERERVRRIARAAGIPLQTGLTQGGTDGTTFTFYGAPNQGLSWPGRYSHSPGEVLDLRDLARLSELIVAVATAGPGDRPAR